MNGIHDMGGMHGMGPIEHERSEPVFHAPWEGRAFALWITVGDWTGGADRYEVELIPPGDYLRLSYWERRMAGLAGLLLRTNMVTAAEIARGKAIDPGTRKAQGVTLAELQSKIATGDPASRNVAVAPLFREGQRVRACNMHPATHTRLPRYTRGRIGKIERDYGVFVFPDTSAHGLGDKPQHVYSVRFAARELWGNQANPQDSVYVDMWDDYHESA